MSKTNHIPTSTATLAQIPKGTIVRLGGKFWAVGKRPHPGFVILHREDGTEYEDTVVRLRTKVGVLTSGKLVQA